MTNSNLAIPEDQKPLRVVTCNIITNKETSFVSSTISARTPSEIEIAACDWYRRLRRHRLLIHVIGRGDQLTDTYLSHYVSGWLEARHSWKYVHLNEPPHVRPVQDDPEWSEFLAAAGMKS